MSNTPPTVFPELRYRDADAAIEFLVKAFGFEERVVARDDAGLVVHAELALGNGMVMLGQSSPPGDGEWNHGPGSLYVVVDDPDAHHSTAASAGAEIAVALYDTDYGSRNYAARDPEGTVWTFGTYQPFAPEAG
jgi:uncharacterized glyoxalase superfamily protein PhnB